MNKLKMQSKNLVDENIEKISSLFPNCVSEGLDESGKVIKVVDFDLLKQELSNVVVEGNEERYVLNWAGKKQAMLSANAPIAKTLRPAVKESVGKDGTAGKFDSENLYIEGDNLDVLKLLRETYLGKVKMIYIDPPYNTGNDFIYEDDFSMTTEEYLEKSNQIDDQGNRLFTNNDSNGRFHSDWLSMMYSRLRLAKDLLTEDGAIFISIDDNEQHNLRKLCDEVFGSINFVSNIIWHNNKKGRQMDKNIKSTSEYVLLYAKNIQSFQINNKKVDLGCKGYNLTDDYSSYKKGYPLHNGTAAFHINNRPNLCYTIYYKEKTGKAITIDEKIKINGEWKLTISERGYDLLSDGYVRIVAQKNEKYNTQRVWRWGEEKFNKEYEKELMFLKGNDGWYIYQKDRIGADGLKEQKYTNYIDIDTSRGRNSMNILFNNEIVFDFPKPIELISELSKMIINNDDIILDFFSGSATTAHAVMQLNAEDGGNRKHIMVQLPEKTDEKSEAFKAGYKTIPEIAKERIRRAGKKILEDNKNSKEPKDLSNLDIGFRVLKLDDSNMKDVYYSPSELKQETIFDIAENIKEDRTEEDLLFQVMLDMGVLLSSEIKTLDFDGKKVFNVNDGNLVCCFDEDISESVVTQIAQMKPLYAVFRDSSISSDSMSVNFDQIFETYSPTTTRKVL